MPDSAPTATRLHARNAPQDIPIWMLFPLFFVVVFLSHLTLLRLPYFWDEGGYYIPAAWDLFRTGTLIPQSTVTNAHPPLPSILLAGWWHLSGFSIIGTRVLVCMVSAAALLAVFRLARNLSGSAVAIIATLLTALYPVWFAQSTLAHADIFAAAFTLWALSSYLTPQHPEEDPKALKAPISATFPTQLWTATLFSLAVLSKETAIVTPLALATWEVFQLVRTRKQKAQRITHLTWAVTLLIPILPLVAWYAFHYSRTGFIFGNPEFLRYNATANLGPYRILLCLWHRLLHLTTHMNLFVASLCTIAALLVPVSKLKYPALPRPALQAIAVVLLSNWVAFSILGGALLTRYLLPLYPLILLFCVATWRRHVRRWIALAALTAVAFLAGIWINPPYAFAPEDNLTYRDMIVLHQQAINVLNQRFPQATVLTAWPATSELSRPEIGYTRRPFKVTSIQNFSIEQMQLAAAEPGNYDTALIFSTKWEPAQSLNLGKQNEPSDAKYFDFHHDLRPAEAAALLHGEVVWQAHRHGEWAAVLHFPRIVNARLNPSH
ncbi:glycosyltransferase family 39 protein [Granulicella sp. dw_53]|uniref:ArnT family glycosyltransferase n=1 Tax=Granulicella sp. dw_53 TaxID=2719792 RepID=UPI00210279BD|nr:glycosyltransferase family 39 protein [Granulicella sp. dw_53]